MIKLFYSNKTEALLKNLAINLELQKGQGFHPLEPVEIIVPNRNMETWVRLGLAQAKGIAANIKFKWLENYISDLVSTSSGEKFRLVDYQTAEASILAALLDDQLLEGKDFRPIHSYLENKNPGNKFSDLSIGFDSYLGADGTDIRRVQLATRMATLFQEYSFSRPEMISAWRSTSGGQGFEARDSSPFGNPEQHEPLMTETAGWQKALWLSVFGEGGILENNLPNGGGKWITIDQLAYNENFLGLLNERGLKPVHVFGVSYVARIYQVLFARLGEASTLYIYSLNPCAEFWEDVETDREYIYRLGREVYRRKKRLWEGKGEPDTEDPFGLFEADNPALRYWGRPGREHVRLLGELTDCDFYDAFTNPLESGSGLLHHFQKDILDRNPEKTRNEGFLQADDTINMVAAPSVRREVEWVADQIWSLMRDDNTRDGQVPLRFSDIAVIINSAEHERYLPQIETIFTACQNLPFTVSDLPGKAGSKTIEAMLLLLKLPFGRFTRTEMLTFMSHPAVISRFEHLTPEGMAAKADKLGIVFGADHSDHEGTYIDEDVLNWSQGIKRLALGAFMSGEKSGDNRIYQGDTGRWIIEESAGSDIGTASQFGLLSRALLNDARYIRRAKATLSRWADFFRSQAERYLHAESAADSADRMRVIKALSRLEGMDLGGKVSGRVAAALAVKLLDSLPGNRGQYLAEGVAVSSFLPMRAIPFKVVFVLGMGEGLFPAAGRRDALDLRAAQRRAGDVDSSERDRYMFLETILSTREKLYLSYVKRDELTGDPLQPSAVVQELLHILRLGFLGPDNIKNLFIDLPLRRFDDRRAIDHTYLDEAKAEAKIRELAEDLHDRIYPAGKKDLPAIWKVLPRNSREALTKMLILPGETPQLSISADKNETISLTLASLHNFLSCPMQGWASAVLGLSEAEEDLAEYEEEDFEFSPLAKTSLLREVFYLSAAENLEFSKAYDTKAERLRLSGQIPVGSLGRIYREHHLVILQGWQKLLEEKAICTDRPVDGDGNLPSLERIRFGQTGRHLPATKIYDPIMLEILSGDSLVPLRLNGTTESLAENRATTIILQPKAAPAKSINKTSLLKCSRQLLRGIIDHLFLSAAGLAGDNKRRIVLLYADQDSKADLLTLNLNPVTTEKALNWLAVLAGDLINNTHAYLLPCEAVFPEMQARISGLPEEHSKAFKTANIINGEMLHKNIVSMAEDGRFFFSSLWGPVPEPRSYCPPDPGMIADLVAGRMGLIFEDVIDVEDLR